MNTKGQAEFAIIVVAVLICAVALFGLQSAGLLSIVGETRAHTVSGERVELSANWRNIPDRYSDGCIQKVLDQSEENLSAVVKVEVQGEDCSNTIETTVATIPDLDISKYESVVIRRTWEVQACGETARITMKSTFMDGNGKEFSPGGTGRSCKNALVSDIYFRNDGTSISMKSNEGDFVYDASKPLFFKNTVLAGDAQSSRTAALYTYSITGIEKKPFANPPESVGLSMSEYEDYLAEEDGVEAEGNWFTRLLARVAAWFD